MTDVLPARTTPDPLGDDAPAGRRPRERGDSVRTPPWLYAVLTLGLFFVVVPFIWMLLSSFKPEAEVRAVPPSGSSSGP
jgi:multiple sugar transport system permease protein